MTPTSAPPPATRPSPLHVGAADTQPPARGEGLWRPLERGASRLVALSAIGLDEDDNPLLRLGALANFMWLVACATGVLLLVWYTPSHTGAWASVEAMAESPWTAGLLRSLHRYGSDAALLLTLLHGLQMLAQRRLFGPRRLAWVTGIFAVFLMWLVGWLGYWLVWDERAQAVAVGTAKMLDVVPIFSDPIGRSFLTDDGVSSLLFFVVFFVHMLLPLVMAIALWLHLTRLARPRWWPARRLAVGSLVALTALSLMLPATSAGPAAMAETPSPATIDGLYLLPLWLTERLGGGLLWMVFLTLAALFFGAPWWLVKARRREFAVPEVPAAEPSAPRTASHSEPVLPTVPAPPLARDREAEDLRRAAVAVVDPALCNACETCFRDCPFDAIAMVARSDGRRFPSVALVDPARCVGCGICAGSCDSAGIGPPSPRQVLERHRVDAWLSESNAARTIVFACARSAASGLALDDGGRIEGGPADLRVVAVPCAGWVHPLTLERAVRRGAERVVVVSCKPETCVFREGARHTADRLEGRREPSLRVEFTARNVEQLAFDPHEGQALAAALGLSAAEPSAAQGTSALPPRARRRRRWVGALVAVLLVGATAGLAELPYAAVSSPPELVISLRAAGMERARCRTRSAQELLALPPHKRVAEVCERGRAAVRLSVQVDGQALHDERYEAGGAYGDGLSSATVTLEMPSEGEHLVEVALDLGDEKPRIARARRTFVAGRRSVVTFDSLDGFRWH